MSSLGERKKEKKKIEKMMFTEFAGLPDSKAHELMKEWAVSHKEHVFEENNERHSKEAAKGCERVDIEQWLLLEARRKDRHNIALANWKIRVQTDSVRMNKEVRESEVMRRTAAVIKEERGRQALDMWRSADRVRAQQEQSLRIMVHSESKLRATIVRQEWESYDVIDTFIIQTESTLQTSCGFRRKELVGVLGKCPFLDKAQCPMGHIVRCMDPDHVRH